MTSRRDPRTHEVALRRRRPAHSVRGESPPSPHLRDARVGCLLGWRVHYYESWRRIPQRNQVLCTSIFRSGRLQGTWERRKILSSRESQQSLRLSPNRIRFLTRQCLRAASDNGQASGSDVDAFKRSPSASLKLAARLARESVTTR